MAKTPSKVKTKKDKSAKKKKRKADDAAATPKKKKMKKVEKDGSAKKKKKKKKVAKAKEGATETPKKKKKKTKKAKTPDAKSTGKKKRKAKAEDGSAKKKKKGKKGKKGKNKKKKAKKEEEVVKTEEKEEVKEEEAAAPAEEVKTEAAAPAEAAPADTVDDGATVKLFVGNLSFDIDEAGIKKFFEDCGTITDVFWLESKEDGRFLGKGFITFETVDQARKAYAKKDEDLMGRPILVDYAQPRKKAGGNREPRPLSERPEGCTTVFLGNLDFNIEEADVKNFAKDCGEIKSIRWLTNRDTGEFKGCGFCEFTTSDAVDNFVKLNGQSLKGRAIRIDYATSKKSGGGGGGKREPRPLSEKPEGCTTVFCGNLSFEITEDAIHALAKDCGDGVKHIRWLTDRETQEFKGCGFIEFYDTESVDKFVVHNGKEVMGRSIRIDYAKPRAPRE